MSCCKSPMHWTKLSQQYWENPQKYGKWSLSIVLLELQHYINTYDSRVYSFCSVCLHISSPNPNGKAVGASITATSCAFIVHEEMKVCCTAKRSAVCTFRCKIVENLFWATSSPNETHRVKIPISWGENTWDYILLASNCHHHSCVWAWHKTKKFAPTILSHIDPGVLERLLFAKKGCDMRSRIKSCEIQ